MLPFLNMYIRSLDSSTLPSASITPGRFTRCDADMGDVTGATRDTRGISLSALSDFLIWEIPPSRLVFSSHNEPKVISPSNASRDEQTVFGAVHSIFSLKSCNKQNTKHGFTQRNLLSVQHNDSKRNRADPWPGPCTAFSPAARCKNDWFKVNSALLLSHDHILRAPRGSESYQKKLSTPSTGEIFCFALSWGVVVIWSYYHSHLSLG